MTATEDWEPTTPAPSSNGHGHDIPAAAPAGFTGQHGKAATDGALRSTQADIDAAGGVGRRAAARVASLRVAAVAARDRLKDDRRLLNHTVREAARTPVRYPALSATTMMVLTLLFFAGDTITLHLAFSLADNPPVDAWLVPLAVSAPVVLGTRFVIRVLLDSIAAPEEGPDAPPATPVTEPVAVDDAILADRERALDRRTEAVRRVRFRVFVVLLAFGLLGLAGVAIGFALLGGPVLGGNLGSGLTFGGGAFIVGMLLLNTAGSGAVATYSYVCGSAEYAQVRRGFTRQGAQHVRLARTGVLPKYEGARAALAVRLLRADARKRAGKLDGHRRVFMAGDAAGLAPLATTMVGNLEVPKEKAPTRLMDELLPPSLMVDEPADPTEKP